MEQLKSLLNTKNVITEFSVSHGAPLLAEFSKLYPTTRQQLEGKHISRESPGMEGIEEKDIAQFNRTVDVYAEFTEEIFGIVGSFFVKSLEIKEKEKFDEWTSPDTLVASRILNMTFALGAHLLIQHALRDKESEEVSIPFVKDLSEEQLIQIKKLYALQKFAMLMNHQLSAVATSMGVDISPMKS